MASDIYTRTRLWTVPYCILLVPLQHVSSSFSRTTRQAGPKTKTGVATGGIKLVDI